VPRAKHEPGKGGFWTLSDGKAGLCDQRDNPGGSYTRKRKRKRRKKSKEKEESKASQVPKHCFKLVREEPTTPAVFPSASQEPLPMAELLKPSEGTLKGSSLRLPDASPAIRQALQAVRGGGVGVGDGVGDNAQASPAATSVYPSEAQYFHQYPSSSPADLSAYSPDFHSEPQWHYQSMAEYEDAFSPDPATLDMPLYYVSPSSTWPPKETSATATSDHSHVSCSTPSFWPDQSTTTAKDETTATTTTTTTSRLPLLPTLDDGLDFEGLMNLDAICPQSAAK